MLRPGPLPNVARAASSHLVAPFVPRPPFRQTMRRIALPLTVLLVAACSGENSGTPAPGESPSLTAVGNFDQLQREVFDKQCVSCHVTGNPFAVQSGLVLEAGKSYDAMVNVLSRQAVARAEGMRVVRPGLPDSSLLWHKLQWESGHHARDYGGPMPLGTRSLSVGQLEFVRRWIAAGAPRSAAVGDARLLTDTVRPAAAPFVALAAPPAGQGVQLRVAPFQVTGNFERELFTYQRLGTAAPLFVNRIQMKMRPNSHHFLLYSFADNAPAFAIPPLNTVRDIRNPDGSLNFLNVLPMAYHVFLAGAQTPEMDYRFPAGVALRLPANFGIDLNVHYVNRGSEPLTGEAFANLYSVESSQVQNEARTLNLANNDIALPPGVRTTLTKTFMNTTGRDMRVFMLTSHMHQLGERFQIKLVGGARNGQLIYETTDWQHPEIKNFDTPIVIRPGEGMMSEIVWNNTTSRTVRFGLTSQDEMGIIFGYYY
jgi:hypothetical protein